jgi:hypothetical protein
MSLLDFFDLFKNNSFDFVIFVTLLELTSLFEDDDVDVDDSERPLKFLFVDVKLLGYDFELTNLFSQ